MIEQSCFLTVRSVSYFVYNLTEIKHSHVPLSMWLTSFGFLYCLPYFLQSGLCFSMFFFMASSFSSLFVEKAFHQIPSEKTLIFHIPLQSSQYLKWNRYDLRQFSCKVCGVFFLHIRFEFSRKSQDSSFPQNYLIQKLMLSVLNSWRPNTFFEVLLNNILKQSFS